MGARQDLEIGSKLQEETGVCVETDRIVDDGLELCVWLYGLNS